MVALKLGVNYQAIERQLRIDAAVAVHLRAAGAEFRKVVSSDRAIHTVESFQASHCATLRLTQGLAVHRIGRNYRFIEALIAPTYRGACLHFDVFGRH